MKLLTIKKKETEWRDHDESSIKIKKAVAAVWVILLRMFFVGISIFYFAQIMFVEYVLEFICCAFIAISMWIIPIRDTVKLLL